MHMIPLGQVAVTSRHITVLEQVKKKMNVLHYAQVMRWAIAELKLHPDTIDTEIGPFAYRIPTTTVTPDQIALVNQLAIEKGVSRSQIVRNAIQALAIKYQTRKDLR